jgi:dTDP-4-amino-4,6-dideoxygalactose transaminase
LAFNEGSDALEGASALVATHVFGAPCRPAAIEQLASAAGVPLLFDAAHAFGASSRGDLVGGFGDAEVFSLTPTKVLVAGEGGLVATRDAGLARRLRAARDYGNEGDYNPGFPGLNARLSEFNAAMALESLSLLGDTMRARNGIAAQYTTALDGVAGVACQAIPVTDESTFKDLAIRVDEHTFGLSRDLLAATLTAEGIETRKYFDPPLHVQKVFAGAQHGAGLSAVEQLSRSVLCLPIYPDLPSSVVERTVEVIVAAHDNASEIQSSPIAARLASRVPRSSPAD